MRVSHMATVSIALPNGFVAWKFPSSFQSFFIYFAVHELIVIRLLAVVRGRVTYPILPPLKWKLVDEAAKLPLLLLTQFQR